MHTGVLTAPLYMQRSCRKHRVGEAGWSWRGVERRCWQDMNLNNATSMYTMYWMKTVSGQSFQFCVCTFFATEVVVMETGQHMQYTHTGVGRTFVKVPKCLTKA